MLYDPIFSKSFSRNDQKRFGHFAFFGCVVIALSICTVFKPQLHVQLVYVMFLIMHLIVMSLTILLAASVNLQLSGTAGIEEDNTVVKDTITSKRLNLSAGDGEDREIAKDTMPSKQLKLSTSNDVEHGEVATDILRSEQFQKSTSDGDKETAKHKIVSQKLQLSEPLLLSTNDGVEIAKDTIVSEPLQLSSSGVETDEDTIVSEPLQLSTSDGTKDKEIAEDTIVSERLQLSASDTLAIAAPIEVDTKLIEPLCSLSEPISDYCDIKGDIRVHPNSSTIFVAYNQIGSSTKNGTWVIKPYARKGNKGAMQSVKSWTIRVVPSHESSPSCTRSQNIPAILFSLAGYSGNHFHDFADIIIPLYSTSQKFDGQVHFLATNYKSWWISKFRGIVEKLSRFKVIDIDREEGTLCYESMIVGLKTRKELGIDHVSDFHDGLSMKKFIDFLRSTYSLKRKTATKIRNSGMEKPRLLIVSRKRTRTLTNERRVTKMAQSMGYQVITADATLSTNLSNFAELVNSCDVLMGVHGAGLTNMVYLPDNAVVIQIVPLGIEGFARHDFEEPAMDMKIRYLEYKISAKESSLIEQYSVNSAVVRDPLSVHKNDWNVIRSVYLDKQNVKLDVRRFRGTLLKALKLLQQ